MTADRQALKAAVLPVVELANNNAYSFNSSDHLADAIVAAVIAVDDERGSVEWRDEWRVVHTFGSSTCASCWSTGETEEEARRDLAQAIGEGSWGDVWIEHRRASVGATEWERVTE